MDRNEYALSKVKKIKFLSFGSPLIDLIGDVDDEFMQK